MKSNYSNSQIGSSHWYRTVLSKVKHIGEFIQKDSPLPIDHSKKWGEDLVGICEELINSQGKNVKLIEDDTCNEENIFRSVHQFSVNNLQALPIDVINDIDGELASRGKDANDVINIILSSDSSKAIVFHK